MAYLANFNIKDLNWTKALLIPSIIQDINSNEILMLGYMNEESLCETIRCGKVTFFSRSKNRLWMKGETSGNFLMVRAIYPDCDYDSLLIKAQPMGSTCHLGNTSCFTKRYENDLLWLTDLENIIYQRYRNPQKGSYTSELFRLGCERITQKVGEECVELIIAALAKEADVKDEGADLLFHFLVLLQSKGLNLSAIVQTLMARHK